MKVIEVKTSDDLHAMEKALRVVDSALPGEELLVRLSRRPKAHFFKESRMLSLLSTIAQKGGLIVQDWHHQWDEGDRTVFRESPATLAAAILSKALINDKGALAPFSAEQLRNEIGQNGGILEPHNSTALGSQMIGKALTFCAVDPFFAEPLSLSGMVYDKQRFIDAFLSFKCMYLDQNRGAVDTQLAGYVFELYQNGFEHGRFDREGKVVGGLRFVGLRRHTMTNLASAQKQAGTFKELRKYIQDHSRRSKGFKFYEISVSDQGMGILNRFVSSCPEFSSEADQRSNRLALLKRLLREPLTSKKQTRGAGFGLEKALAAVRTLNGFVSLRTDVFWLFASFSGTGQSTLALDEVSLDRPPGYVIGTHFNALIPING